MELLLSQILEISLAILPQAGWNGLQIGTLSTEPKMNLKKFCECGFFYREFTISTTAQ